MRSARRHCQRLRLHHRRLNEWRRRRRPIPHRRPRHRPVAASTHDASNASLSASATIGECRGLGRRGKRECMRRPLLSVRRRGELRRRIPPHASCAYFGRVTLPNLPSISEACLARMTTRYKSCIDVLGGHGRSTPPGLRRRMLAESNQLCLDELQGLSPIVQADAGAASLGPYTVNPIITCFEIILR